MTTTNNTDTTECAYCGRDVQARETPDAGSFEWRLIAAEHAHSCEWVATRAHRLDIPTDDALRALRQESAAAGDSVQVRVCDAALGGEANSLALCSLVIAYAAAMRSATR
jgi:hypothetical protein